MADCLFYRYEAAYWCRDRLNLHVLSPRYSVTTSRSREHQVWGAIGQSISRSLQDVLITSTNLNAETWHLPACCFAKLFAKS
jgi:hypothetical protein